MFISKRLIQKQCLLSLSIVNLSKKDQSLIRFYPDLPIINMKIPNFELLKILNVPNLCQIIYNGINILALHHQVTCSIIVLCANKNQFKIMAGFG